MVVGNGVGVWSNNGTPRHLTEVWRAGGTRESQHLGTPVAATASTSGRLAIVDWMLAEVTLIESDGRWHDSWVPNGRGPGEVSQPIAIAWTPGDELVVFDIGGAKVEWVTDSGPARPPLRLPSAVVAAVVNAGELRGAAVGPDGSIFVEPGLEKSGEATAVARLIRHTAHEFVEDTVATMLVPTLANESHGMWPAPGWPQIKHAIGPDGRIALATGAAYRITVLDPSGGVTALLCRDADPLPLDAAELLDTTAANASLRAALADAPRPDTLAAIGRLFYDASGRLWVQRQRPRPGTEDALLGRPAAVHDVFNAAGEYLGSIVAPPNARLQTARGDTVWAFETGEYDETWVVAYRIDR